MNIEKANWKKSFFTIWTGQAISILTSSIVQFAIIWWLTDRTKSAAVLAVASLIGFVPHAVLGLFAGVVVDRYSRKAIMIISDLVISAACLLIAVFGFFSEIPIWLVMVVLFVRSIGSSFHYPALQATIPLLVPEDMLAKCNGYSQTFQSVSIIISPAIAAFFYATFSLNTILFVDVFGAVLGVLAILIVKIPELTTDRPTESPKFIKEIKEGIHVLYEQKGLFWLAVIGAVFMVVFMPVNSLFPLMTMSYFGGTAWHASIVEIVFGVGMMLGSLAIGATGGFKDKIFSIFLCMALFGALLLFSGILRPTAFVVFAVLSGIMGLTVPLYNGPYMTLMQEKIAPEYLGRVISLSSGMMMIATPIGLVLSGIFAEIVGINVWFAVSGVLIVIVSLFCMIVPSVRRSDRSAPADKT